MKYYRIFDKQRNRYMTGYYGIQYWNQLSAVKAKINEASRIDDRTKWRAERDYKEVNPADLYDPLNNWEIQECEFKVMKIFPTDWVINTVHRKIKDMG